MVKAKRLRTKSNGQLFLNHARLHYWWNNPKMTSWTKAQIRKEHTRLVKIILKRGYKHNSPLR